MINYYFLVLVLTVLTVHFVECTPKMLTPKTPNQLFSSRTSRVVAITSAFAILGSAPACLAVRGTVEVSRCVYTI